MIKFTSSQSNMLFRFCMKTVMILFQYHIWLMPLMVISQHRDIDSLLIHHLTVDKVDSTLVEMLNDSSWEYRENGDTTQALRFARTALAIGEKIDCKLCMSSSFNRMGNIYEMQGRYQSALEMYQQALEIDSSKNFTYGIARSNYQKAVIYKLLGDYPASIKYSKRATDLFRQIAKPLLQARSLVLTGDGHKLAGKYEASFKNYYEALNIYQEKAKWKDVAILYNKLGLLYRRMNLRESAKKMFEDGLSLLESLNNNDLETKAQLFSNIGSVYNDLDQYDSAIIYHFKGLKLKERSDDIISKGISYHNIAYVYYNLGKIDSAKKFHAQSLNIRKVSKDIPGLAESYHLDGLIYKAQGRYKEALNSLNASQMLATQTQTPRLSINVLRDLGDVQYVLNEPELAADYYKEATVLRDSLEASENLAMEFERFYIESQTKNLLLEKEVFLQKEKTARKNLQIYAVSGATILLMIIFFTILRGNKQKQRALLSEKNEEISRQKIDTMLNLQELKIMNAMVTGQDEERRRISRELHDHIGSLLSMTQMQFQALEERYEKLEQYNQAQHHKVNQLLNEACDSVRDLSHKIGDKLLMNLGLIPAIEDLIGIINSGGQIRADLYAFQMETRLPNHIEFHTFKIIQELIANTLKHSKASELTIQLIKDDQMLSITVEDNGIGFHPDILSSEKSGLGFINIRSRLNELSGEMNVDSGKGSGTTILIEIPLS